MSGSCSGRRATADQVGPDKHLVARAGADVLVRAGGAPRGRFDHRLAVSGSRGVQPLVGKVIGLGWLHVHRLVGEPGWWLAFSFCMHVLHVSTETFFKTQASITSLSSISSNRDFLIEQTALRAVRGERPHFCWRRQPSTDGGYPLDHEGASCSI